VAPEIEDPILERLPFGPKVEPRRKELLKGDEAARTTGPPPKERPGGPVGWLRLLGPGLITGASDDDPSGIGTYSQVGSQFGYGLLWTALFTYPLMAAVQELCGRIALETGVGLGTALRRKFPTWLVGACILALVVANTINLGADLGAVAAGGALLTRGAVRPIWLVIPTALLVIVLQFFFTYRAIFSVFKWLTLALFAYVAAGFVAHPQVVELVRATFVPHIELSRDFITAIVAILGTTISPYLFFWQASAEIDQRSAGGTRPDSLSHHLSSRALRAARADILTGMAVSQLVMYFIILTSAAVLHAHGKTDVQTAEEAAQALSPIAGPLAFVLFAAGMIGTGLLAVPILSGSAAYAVKEFAGFSGTLGFKVMYRPTFYGVIGAATVAGVAMNFAHVDAIRALFLTAVINGVVAPPLLLLIVLLGSDTAFMGDRVSGGWSKLLTWAATILMALAAIAMSWTMLAGR
jgi:NRAMP (natural resistance-associated macrophage protein)-like metal ion transporter